VQPGDQGSLEGADERTCRSPTMTPAHQGQLLGFEISAAVMAAPTAPTKPTDSRSRSRSRRRVSEAEQDEERRLDEQVDDVARGEELRLLHLEDDDDEDQAGQDGQRAALAVADPLPPGAEVLAERVGQDVGGDGDEIFGRSSPAGSTPVWGGLALGSGTASVSVMRYPVSCSSALRGGGGCDAGSRSIERPVVMKSTTTWLSKSDAGRSDHVAEVEDGDAFRDLEHVVQVVGDDDHGHAVVGQPLDEVEDHARLRHPSAAVGSSMMTSLALDITALATATDWR